MRPIDADELYKEVTEKYRDINAGSYPFNIVAHDMAQLVKNAPTVDAVEVVRCKDCKHWKHFSHLGCTDFVKVCGLANYMIGENGYCLYGERKEKGE